jgi:hypothetical protein
MVFLALMVVGLISPFHADNLSFGTYAITFYPMRASLSRNIVWAARRKSRRLQSGGRRKGAFLMRIIQVGGRGEGHFARSA